MKSLPSVGLPITILCHHSPALAVGEIKRQGYVQGQIFVMLKSYGKVEVGNSAANS